MAPRSKTDSGQPESDRLDGVPHPRETRVLHGLNQPEMALLEAYRSGRMHHAWIIHGPRGIGKATLAYRLAAFMLANPDPAAPKVQQADGLDVDDQAQAVRLVRAGSHPDLMTVRRTWDPKGKRFRSVLPVDEIRKVSEFFNLTAGFGGWRIAIVDSADDMNLSAANALLKTLEEPPARALIILISSAPARLLGTIRSRCRRLGVAPPGEADLGAALRAAGAGEAYDALDIQARARLLRIADGSVRSAIELLNSGGLDLHGAIDDIMQTWPEIDFSKVHELAGKAARRGADQAFETVLQGISAWLERQIEQPRGTGEGGSADSSDQLARMAQVWDKIENLKAETGTFHFERKQVILKAFRCVSTLSP